MFCNSQNHLEQVTISFTSLQQTVVHTVLLTDGNSKLYGADLKVEIYAFTGPFHVQRGLGSNCASHDITCTAVQPTYRAAARPLITLQGKVGLEESSAGVMSRHLCDIAFDSLTNRVWYIEKPTKLRVGHKIWFCSFFKLSYHLPYIGLLDNLNKRAWHLCNASQFCSVTKAELRKRGASQVTYNKLSAPKTWLQHAHLSLHKPKYIKQGFNRYLMTGMQQLQTWAVDTLYHLLLHQRPACHPNSANSGLLPHFLVTNALLSIDCCQPTGKKGLDSESSKSDEWVGVHFVPLS